MQPALTVVIPTYKEATTILNTISKLCEIAKIYKLPMEILVVDDNSPDGTAKLASGFVPSTELATVRVIVRTKDKGLSQAVIAGFDAAAADIILVTDADGSHPFGTIPELYTLIKNGEADVAVGSRYMEGGAIEDWPVQRRVISIGATLLARVIFPSVTDPVSGFFAVRKSVVQNVEFYPLGYKILLEVLGRGHWETVKEVPYRFEDRKSGTSKLNHRVIIQYVEHLWRLVKHGIYHTDSIIHKELRHMFGFAGVGITGIVVNIGLLWILTILGIPDMMAILVAIEMSIVSNFLLNDSYVFNMGEYRMKSRALRFTTFQMISMGGALINIFVYALLTHGFGVWYILSDFIAIFVAFSWNFFVNRHRTWRNIP